MLGRYPDISRRIRTLPVYLVFFSGGLNLFFGAFQLVNSLEINFFFAYMPKVVKLTIFSFSVDSGLWATSLIVILLTPLAMKFLRRNRIPHFIIFSHIIVPASCLIILVKSFHNGLMLLTLSGFLALIMMTLYSHELFSLSPTETLVGVFISTLAFIISTQLGSLIVLILYPIFGPIFFANNPLQVLSQIQVNFFYATYPLMVILLVTLLISWIWIPLFNYLIGVMKRVARWNQSILPLSTKRDNAKIREKKDRYVQKILGLRRIVPSAVFLSSIALGLFVAFYVHSFDIELRAADDEWYRSRVDGITSLADLKEMLINEPRWPYLLLLYFIKIVTSQNTIAVVSFGPVLLISLLSITTYWLVNVGKNNWKLASLSSILTIFSIQTTIGLYAGIYANWLAISGMVAFFALFLLALQKQVKKYVILSIVMSILVLLSHPWTWGILIGIIVYYTFVTFLLIRFSSKGRSWNKRELVYPIAVILSNLIFALLVLLMAKNIPLISGAQSGIYSGYIDIFKTLSIENLLDFQAILSSTLTYYVGGLLAIPPLFLLAVLGIWASRSYADNFNRLLLSWITVPLAACLLTISFWQWRLLYLIPFQIPVSIGVFFIINKINQLYKQNSATPGRVTNIFKLLLVVSTILLACNYVLGSIVSFVGNLLVFQ